MKHMSNMFLNRIKKGDEYIKEFVNHLRLRNQPYNFRSQSLIKNHEWDKRQNPERETTGRPRMNS